MAKIEFVFKDNTKNCLNAIGEDLLKNMTAAVNVVKLAVLEKLSQQGTGRVYKVPGTKNTYYTASAPGEPPAVATGNLKQHIFGNVTVSGDTVQGEVGTDVDYGLMLEYGTYKAGGDMLSGMGMIGMFQATIGGGMLPRPWLRPSFEESQAEIEDILQQPIGLEIT